MDMTFVDCLFNDGKTETINGAKATKRTFSAVYDLFARGGAMRLADTEDRELLFKAAFDENPTLALRALFYLRDVRGGQGERKIFRDCLHYAAKKTLLNAFDMNDIIELIPEYGRWDDLYAFVNTPYEKEAFLFMKKQLKADLSDTTGSVSLLGKWLKSENTSSAESKRLARLTRFHFNMTSKEYRKALSTLRKKINIVERLMSANDWNDIEFDKLPSKAGFQYRDTFMNRDETRERYRAFMNDKNSAVNAGVLYPYEVIRAIMKDRYKNGYMSTPAMRKVFQKYWDNLEDYFDNATFNGLAIIDTSGSMMVNNFLPLSVAISLGIYCADRAAGPFHGKFMSFSNRPQLHTIAGFDIFDKVQSVLSKSEISNTNLVSAFDLILKTALENDLTQEQMPESLVIISDMQIDQAEDEYSYWSEYDIMKGRKRRKHEMEMVRKSFKTYGYEMPKLYYWNVNASNTNNFIDDPEEDGVTYLSGCSPTLFTSILTGKTGYELMKEILNSPRYANINVR